MRSWLKDKRARDCRPIGVTLGRRPSVRDPLQQVIGARIAEGVLKLFLPLVFVSLSLPAGQGQGIDSVVQCYANGIMPGAHLGRELVGAGLRLSEDLERFAQESFAAPRVGLQVHQVAAEREPALCQGGGKRESKGLGKSEGHGNMVSNIMPGDVTSTLQRQRATLGDLSEAALSLGVRLQRCSEELAACLVELERLRASALTATVLTAVLHHENGGEPP
jgi:hypothetical protein